VGQWRRARQRSRSRKYGLVAREAFDVVILGTGAAGLTAAIAASEDGEPIVGLYAAGNVMPRRSV